MLVRDLTMEINDTKNYKKSITFIHLVMVCTHKIFSKKIWGWLSGKYLILRTFKDFWFWFEIDKNYSKIQVTKLDKAQEISGQTFLTNSFKNHCDSLLFLILFYCNYFSSWILQIFFFHFFLELEFFYFIFCNFLFNNFNGSFLLTPNCVKVFVLNFVLQNIMLIFKEINVMHFHTNSLKISHFVFNFFFFNYV